MIVVAIMGLLAAIAIPSFVKAKQQATCNKLGYTFLRADGSGIYGLNESTFEVALIDAKAGKVGHTLGVVNVSKMPILEWKKLSWAEQQGWLLNPGTMVQPVAQWQIDAEKKKVMAEQKQVVSADKKVDDMADLMNKSVEVFPDVIEMKGVKYYREGVKKPEDKEDPQGYSKKASSINSFLNEEF